VAQLDPGSHHPTALNIGNYYSGGQGQTVKVSADDLDIGHPLGRGKNSINVPGRSLANFQVNRMSNGIPDPDTNTDRDALPGPRTHQNSALWLHTKRNNYQIKKVEDEWMRMQRANLALSGAKEDSKALVKAKNVDDFKRELKEQMENNALRTRHEAENERSGAYAQMLDKMKTDIRAAEGNIHAQLKHKEKLQAVIKESLHMANAKKTAEKMVEDMDNEKHFGNTLPFMGAAQNNYMKKRKDAEQLLSDHKKTIAEKKS